MPWTRPGKLRLPESTAAATTPRFWMASAMTGTSGPELPMQVVQPKPTMPKPSASRSVTKPAAAQIVRGRGRARRQRGLDPGWRRQPALARFAGEEARGEQHLRVGGVGAAGDRCDRDRTVARAGGTALFLARGLRAGIAADVADQVVLDVRRPPDRGRGHCRAQPVLRPLGPASDSSTLARSSSRMPA